MIDKIDSVTTTVLRWMSIILVSVAACVLVSWIFVMVLAISTRAFLGMSWQFIEEYTAYFHLVAACGGFSYATYKGRHLAIQVITSRASGRAKLILECITTSLSIWFVAFLSLKVVAWAAQAKEGGTASLQTQSPMWIPILIMAIGFCTLLLSFLIHLFRVAVMAYRGSYEVSEHSMQREE